MWIESCISPYVGRKNVDSFSTWAFGENYKKLDAENLIVEWNTRHGHRYYISVEMQNPAILQKMNEIWLDTISKDNKDKTK